MGRRRRPHSPGTVFHLVSRTHRGQRWFVPEVRSQIAELVDPIVARTDMQLLAYAIMPNHLHFVVRQGEAPLSDLMQPLMRRVAHRVQKHHGFSGTVVERPYLDRPCMDARHVREALLYTHLNPWRASLCGGDLAYPWTTLPAYLPGRDPASFGIDPHIQLMVLQLFALADDQRRDPLCEDHLRWLEWRMEQDRPRADDRLPHPFVPRPSPGAQRAWRLNFAPDPSYDGPAECRHSLPDLRDFALAQLGQLAAGVSLDELRRSPLTHALARTRRALLKSAAERGYRTGEIARFFGVSPQTVSRAKYHTTDH